MIVSRREKESHLDTIHYEVELLRYSFAWIIKNWANTRPGERYVHLETFLMHYRNLVDFLAGRGGHQHLQFPHGQTWAGRDITKEELAEIQEPALKLWQKYDGLISIYLVHCTVQRADDKLEWDISEMMREVEAVIRRFLGRFPKVGLPSLFPVSDNSTSYGTNTVQVF
jgi:hypothetical protein